MPYGLPLFCLPCCRVCERTCGDGGGLFFWQLTEMSDQDFVNYTNTLTNNVKPVGAVPASSIFTMCHVCKQRRQSTLPLLAVVLLMIT